MRKGVFFSIDAVLGIMVVLTAIAAIALLYSGTSNETVFQSIKHNASDAATVAFYLGKTNTDPSFPDLGNAISPSAKEGYCGHHFTYDPDNGPGQYPINNGEEVFCGER